jgi:hypothetical protein
MTISVRQGEGILRTYNRDYAHSRTRLGVSGLFQCKTSPEFYRSFLFLYVFSCYLIERGRFELPTKGL